MLLIASASAGLGPTVYAVSSQEQPMGGEEGAGGATCSMGPRVAGRVGCCMWCETWALGVEAFLDVPCNV